MAKGPHHRGRHQARAKAVTDAAYANPDTRCWRCGGRLFDRKRGDRWEAGHLIGGQVDGELRAEHRSCNRADAARRTNAKRRGIKHTSADW